MKQTGQTNQKLTVSDIGDYCLVSKMTVRRWIRDGRLSATKLPGGHYRINSADFRDFLERYGMPIRDDLLESKS